MSINVKKVILAEQQDEPGDILINKNYLGLVKDIQVECTVRIGTLKITIEELRNLKAEQTLQLEQKTNQPIELILNEQVIAYGELMCFEEQFAIQITEVLN